MKAHRSLTDTLLNVLRANVAMLLTYLIIFACHHSACAQQTGNNAAAKSTANTGASASVLCASSEYYCGGNLVMLEPLYNAIQQGSCEKDDSGMMVCGTEIIDASMYTAVKGANCQQGCTDGAVSVGLAESYYWLVSDWSGCPAPCDGGWQTRQVTCVNADNNRTVGTENCNPDNQPRSRRTCNATPCGLLVDSSAQVAQYAPWGVCDVGVGMTPSCNTSAYCANAQGVLVPCLEVPLGALLRSCTGATACSPEGAMWVPGPWGPCNATCDGGVSRRTLTCVDPVRYHKLPEQACGTKPDTIPTTRICGTAPCIGYTWRVEAFTSCSKQCGGGIKNRTVACVDQFGVPAEGLRTCEGPPPAPAVACNVQPCDFCSTTDCSRQGVCRNDVCSCTNGYRGMYCEIPPSCPGLLDKNGNCCADGKIDVNGTCCAGGALDFRGHCCPSGRLDACGKCDGSAKTVDVVLACSDSGVLDGAGYCCKSGMLDECGVCDGDGSSCAMAVQVDLQVPSVSIALQLGIQTIATGVPTFISSIIQQPAARIQLQEIVWTELLSSPAANDALLRATLQVQAGSDVSAAQSYRLLQLSLGTQPQPPLYFLSSIRNVTRQSVCGNGVCETGEWDPSAKGLGGCPHDCPFPLNLCPRDPQGALCGGHGRCLYPTGQCVCFVPYQGAACDTCAEGFVKDASGTGCARYVKADLPYLSDSSGASVWAVLGVGIALCVVGGALLCVALGIIIMQRKKIRQMSRAILNSGSQSASGARGGGIVVRGRCVSLRERRGHKAVPQETPVDSDASAHSARALLARYKSDQPQPQAVNVIASTSPLRSVVTGPAGSPRGIPGTPATNSASSSENASTLGTPGSAEGSPRLLFGAFGGSFGSGNASHKGNSMRQLFSRLRPEGESEREHEKNGKTAVNKSGSQKVLEMHAIDSGKMRSSQQSAGGAEQSPAQGPQGPLDPAVPVVAVPSAEGVAHGLNSQEKAQSREREGATKLAATEGPKTGPAGGPTGALVQDLGGDSLEVARADLHDPVFAADSHASV